MAGMFGSAKKPAAPKPARMPNADDAEIAAAGERTRAEAMRRSGRMSTIMTDGPMTTGSSGQKLGA